MKTLSRGLAAVAVLAVGGMAGSAAAQTGTIIEKIIVKVNGELFTLTELERQQIEALQSQNLFVENPEALQSDAALQSALAQITPVVLVTAVDDLLFLDRANQLGVGFGDTEYEDMFDRVREQNGLTEEGMRQAMAEQGISPAELRRVFERQYKTQAVLQLDGVTQMNLTDEELRQYYDAHRDEFMQDETVMLREIFVEVPTETRDGQPVVNVAVDDAALEKMQATRARALAGESFVALVTEVSESASKDSGGLIGPVKVSELSATMRDVIGDLEVGGISEPVRTSRGYQMLFLESRSAAEPLPFREVRDQIRTRILNERIDVEGLKLLDKLRAEAVIEWKDQDYKAIYEAGLVARAAEMAASGRGGGPPRR